MLCTPQWCDNLATCLTVLIKQALLTFWRLIRFRFDRLEKTLRDMVSILFSSNQATSIEPGNEPRRIDVNWFFDKFSCLSRGSLTVDKGHAHLLLSNKKLRFAFLYVYMLCIHSWFANWGNVVMLLPNRIKFSISGDWEMSGNSVKPNITHIGSFGPL